MISKEQIKNALGDGKDISFLKNRFNEERNSKYNKPPLHLLNFAEKFFEILCFSDQHALNIPYAGVIVFSVVQSFWIREGNPLILCLDINEKQIQILMTYGRKSRDDYIEKLEYNLEYDIADPEQAAIWASHRIKCGIEYINQIVQHKICISEKDLKDDV